MEPQLGKCLSEVIKPPLVQNSATVERRADISPANGVNKYQVPYPILKVLRMPVIDGLLSSSGSLSLHANGTSKILCIWFDCQ